MSRPVSVRTQFVVFVLFGDVLAPRGGTAWTSGLLQLLRALGVSDRAARSTLSRMRRRGWLRSERVGRRSRYTLTARGRRLLTEGGQRIFEPRKWAWDGRWHMVVYSLPESKRALRNALRKRLSWLGFGRLAPGTWISVHDRREELAALFDELGVGRYAVRFASLRLVDGEDCALVARCWDLPNLNRRYARFLQRWEPRARAALSSGRNPLSPSQSFVEQFWMTLEYSAFPRLDPNLPSALLPDGWLGDRAADLAERYRKVLNPQAGAFVSRALEAAQDGAEWRGERDRALAA